MSSYAPPDPYARDLATLRAAETTRATQEQRFEDEWKAARLRDLVAESRARDDYFSDHPSPPPRLTTAELSDYAPPDPYAAGIRALQEKEKR